MTPEEAIAARKRIDERMRMREISGHAAPPLAGWTMECPKHGEFIGVSAKNCPVRLGRSIGRTWANEVGPKMVPAIAADPDDWQDAYYDGTPS